MNDHMGYFPQTRGNDCGIACILMIADYFFEKTQIRTKSLNHIKIPETGMSIQDMEKAAEEMGLNVCPLKSEQKKEALLSGISTPFIAHISNAFNYQHYVVISKIAGSKIFIWDPDPEIGKYWTLVDTFLTNWTGYLLIFKKPE